jgi:hypothetical protein
MQEVDRDDPGGLGVQELPSGRACAARRRITCLPARVPKPARGSIT